MSTHTDKVQETKGQNIGNSLTQKKPDTMSTFQLVDNRPEAIAQRKLQETANNSPQVQQAFQLQSIADIYAAHQQLPIQRKENNTGLPDQLKTGMESLSGISLDDVKVHRNSDKPAQLNAHAYAQGTDIHLATGQEKHLPHEAWHVVQQKQGRVKPTLQMKGTVNVNDDAGLEKEADTMGSKALQLKVGSHYQDGNQSLIQRRLNHLGNQILLNGTIQEKTKLGTLVQNSSTFQLQNLHITNQNALIHSTIRPNDGPVQRLLDQYNFNGGNFVGDLSNEHRGVYLVHADNEDIVVKFDPETNELSLMNLARQIGMNVPASRSLSDQEVIDVKAMDNRVRGRGRNRAIAMEFAGGEALQYFRGEHQADQMDGIFNWQLLVDIGKSYGFQLLTASADRWPMPVNVGAATNTSGNSGNVLIDTQSNELHDIDFTDGHPGDQYAESLREFFREMLTNAEGGRLVENVTGFIAREYNANYTIPDEAKPYIVQGIEDAMADIAAVNVGNSGVSQAIENRIADVHLVYTQEVNRLNNQGCCDCYITTACTEAHGLGDDCLELETLRAFRDGYIAIKDEGIDLINLYYTYSPLIVSSINDQNNALEIYQTLYKVINTCVHRIWEEEYEKAFRMYINMVIKLGHEYIPEIVIPLNLKRYIENEIG